MGARLVREHRRPQPARRVRAGEPSAGFLLGEEHPPLEPGPAGRPLDLVLLDRDGTVNVRRPGRYVTGAADLRMLPGAAGAVRDLRAAGVRVVLVTNQRGLATGRLTREELVAVHGALLRRLRRAGGDLDGIFVCPHAEASCDCRKPQPGLLLAALRAAPWARPERTVMIGDQPSDEQAAAAAGIPYVGVGRGRSLSASVARLLG